MIREGYDQFMIAFWETLNSEKKLNAYQILSNHALHRQP